MTDWKAQATALKEKKRRYKLKCKRLKKERNQLRSQLSKLQTGLTCTICCDYLVSPHTIECGHSFCYQCLLQWCRSCFHQEDGSVKACTCPICRTRLSHRPTPSVTLNQQIESLIETKLIKEERNLLRKRQRLDQEVRNRDSAGGELDVWLSIFPGSSLQDTSDGVRRCSICLWEVIDKRCANCGITFDDNADPDPNNGSDGEHSSFDEFGNNLDEYLATDDDGDDPKDIEDDIDDLSEDEVARIPKSRRSQCRFIVDEAESTGDDKSDIDEDAEFSNIAHEPSSVISRLDSRSPSFGSDSIIVVRGPAHLEQENDTAEPESSTDEEDEDGGNVLLNL